MSIVRKKLSKLKNNLEKSSRSSFKNKDSNLTQTVMSAASRVLLEERKRMTGTVVNENFMLQIDKEVRENGIISSLLQKISRRVFMGGFQFQMRVGEKRLEMSQDMKQFIKKFWVPEAEHMLLNIQKYGLTPVVFVPHETPDGNIIVLPKVPMDGSYTIRFQVNEHGSAEYSLFRKHKVLNPDGSTGNRNGKKKKSGVSHSSGIFTQSYTGESTEWENSKVFVVPRFEPSIDGQINSIVSKTMRYIVSFDKAWSNYDQATFEMSRPPYVHSHNTGKSGGNKNEPGPDDIPFGESDTGLDEISERNRLDDAARMSLNRARESAAASNAIQTTEVFNTDTQTIGRRRVAAPWEVRKYDLPEGISLVSSVPQAQVPNAFIPVINELLQIIGNIFEVSDEIGQGSAKKFASNAEFAQRQFNDLIESYQEMLKPIIESSFREIYAKDELEFVEGMVQIIEDVEGEELNDEELRNLANGIGVELIFNNVPDVSLEVLQKLFNDNIIPHEEYKKQALRLYGICEQDCKTGTFSRDLKIQEEERQFKRQKRAQESQMKRDGSLGKQNDDGKNIPDQKGGIEKPQEKKEVKASSLYAQPSIGMKRIFPVEYDLVEKSGPDSPYIQLSENLRKEDDDDDDDDSQDSSLEKRDSPPYDPNGNAKNSDKGEYPPQNTAIYLNQKRNKKPLVVVVEEKELDEKEEEVFFD